MNEQYLGPEPDRTYIATYLESIRNLDPIEIATLLNPVSLADNNLISAVVDTDRFWEVFQRIIARLEERYGIRIDPVRPERYYTALPPEAGAVGGFHDHRSLGYQYWYHASFVVMLGGMTSKELRTIELLRDFIRDCCITQHSDRSEERSEFRHGRRMRQNIVYWKYIGSSTVLTSGTRRVSRTPLPNLRHGRRRQST